MRKEGNKIKQLILTKQQGLAILAVITIIFACLGFYHLGKQVSPTSYAYMTEENPIATFETKETPTYLNFYPTFNDNSKYVHVIVEGSSDGMNYSKVFDTDEQKEGYFAAMIWYHVPLNVKEGMKYFKIKKNDDWNRLVLAEIAFEDRTSRIIDTIATNDIAEKMIDEPRTVQNRSTNKNSAIFDESYFPSSAAEMQDGVYVSEMDHPPLARLIIGIGMNQFGRNPFGFRAMQMLFGIVMIPLIYLFALKLWKKVWVSLLAALLLAVDFLHFTESRLGTLEAFLVVFILLMFYFLYAYHVEDDRFKRKVYLLCSGLFTAFAISTKWSGCYAALGLAVLYFYWMIHDIRQDRSKIKGYVSESLWCVLCFIGIPALIYVIAYIPYHATLEAPGSLVQTVIDHTNKMLSYHTGSSTQYNHPYSSRWWTWLLALKPVFYYWDKIMNIRIYAMGNPMVWGLGLCGVIFTLVRGIKTQKDDYLVIAVAYFSQMIPWFFIGRDTFLYHYYPMVAFLILGICAMFSDGVQSKKLEKWHQLYIISFTILAVIGFCIAFPFTYGLPVPTMSYGEIQNVLLVVGVGMMAVYVAIRLTSYKQEVSEL